MNPLLLLIRSVKLVIVLLQLLTVGLVERNLIGQSLVLGVGDGRIRRWKLQDFLRTYQQVRHHLVESV